MRKTALISAAVLTAVASASAQEFKKVEGLLPNRAEFDTHNGEAEKWHAEVGCKANTLHAQIMFKRVGEPFTIWAPAVVVLLKHGDAVAKNTFVRLSISAPTFKPPFRAQLVVGTVGPHPRLEYRPHMEQVQNYAAAFTGDQAIPLSITWSADGEVAATVAGEVQRVSLHGPIDYIEVAGSSGAGVLDPLEIGIVGDLGCKPPSSVPLAAAPAG
jgi:hypothetical protein